MKTLALVALLCFSACGPGFQPRLVTRCGLQYMGSYPDADSVPGWNDVSLQQAEDRVVEVLARVVNADARFTQHQICESLDGVQLYVHPEAAFVRSEYSADLKPPKTPPSEYDQTYLVAGLSDCAARIMVLANMPDSPKVSAFGHEAAHFTQKCSPRPDPTLTSTDRDTISHQNWLNDGIFAATDEINYQ